MQTDGDMGDVDHAGALESLNEIIKQWENMQDSNSKEGLKEAIKIAGSKAESATKNKRKKLDENREMNVDSTFNKPVDLYQRILNNIDNYSYLCDDEFAGPITKKEILAHLSNDQNKADTDTVSTKNQNKVKNMPKAPVTVPKAPKFITDKRLSQKDKQNVTTEELELQEINKMRSEVEKRIKTNQVSYKQLDKYEKPAFSRKEATTFKEFSLHTNERSSRHSEFRKQNFAKLEEMKELEKQKEEQKKKEEKLKREQAIKYYNANLPSEQKSKRDDSENKEAFVSLRSQLENVLVRQDKEEERYVTSPVSRTTSRKGYQVRILSSL